jgi:CheY-like chemotaxis protein
MCAVSTDKPRVLVVDDDKSVHELIGSLLARAGMESVPVTNAREAAEVLRQRPLPDMVILDLMLPDVSGLELLRQIRSKDIFNGLPVVILSALADPEQIREGLQLGADRYLTKPYLANNLVSTLQDLRRTGRKR